jgi:hypothetical protein
MRLSRPLSVAPIADSICIRLPSDTKTGTTAAASARALSRARSAAVLRTRNARGTTKANATMTEIATKTSIN